MEIRHLRLLLHRLFHRGRCGPPGRYDDFEHTECRLAIGSSLPEQHPVIFPCLRQALEKCRFPVTVVDPRVTDFV